MENYQEQVTKFLKDTDTKFEAKYFAYAYYFPQDKEQREIYKITLKTPKGSYTFKFGQSIASQGKKPTPYDVLSCLTKYDVGSFEDFCGEFGYDTDRRTTKRIFKAVVKEWENISRIYTTEQIALLQEIN